MATMIIDRKILPEQVMSLFMSPRIAVTKQVTGDVVFSPIVNPDDYNCDSDYLHAVPGMVDKILAAANAPDDEWEDVPEELFRV